MADSREHETQLRVLGAQPREGLEEARVVLVWPGSRRIEEERLSLDTRVR